MTKTPAALFTRPTCEVCCLTGSDVTGFVHGDTEYLLCDTCAMAVESGEHTL